MSIGGRPLSNLRFADDIDLQGGSEEELQQLIERLENTAAGYGVEMSADKCICRSTPNDARGASWELVS